MKKVDRQVLVRVGLMFAVALAIVLFMACINWGDCASE